MTEDKFFEKLRDDAQPLRYEPADDVAWTRLQARIRARIGEHPSAEQLLARWFRPVATMLAALSLVAALSVRYIDQTEQTATIETMASASAPAPDFGDTLSVE